MAFEDELLLLIPKLRGYARQLVRDRHDADDLVQDVVVRALGAKERFEPGTNMRAWLFTILRNRFFNKYVPGKRDLVSIETAPPAALRIEPVQEWAIANLELRRAFALLPQSHRDVLLLSAGAELSYEEIGQIIGCAVGTVKSRVFRARRELAALMERPAKAAWRDAGED
jgi:RNA polymerase sigma-70 factor (ECF subfamily)